MRSRGWMGLGRKKTEQRDGCCRYMCNSLSVLRFLMRCSTKYINSASHPSYDLTAAGNRQRDPATSLPSPPPFFLISSPPDTRRKPHAPIPSSPCPYAHGWMDGPQQPTRDVCTFSPDAGPDASVPLRGGGGSPSLWAIRRPRSCSNCSCSSSSMRTDRGSGGGRIRARRGFRVDTSACAPRAAAAGKMPPSGNITTACVAGRSYAGGGGCGRATEWNGMGCEAGTDQLAS